MNSSLTALRKIHSVSSRGQKLQWRPLSFFSDFFVTTDERQREILFADAPPVDLLVSSKQWEVVLDNAYGGTSTLNVQRGAIFICVIARHTVVLIRL